MIRWPGVAVAVWLAVAGWPVFAATVYLPTVTSIPIDVFIPDSVSGNAVSIAVYRYNAGSRQQLDFSDSTFGGTITTPTIAMTWVGDGLWTYLLDFAAITNENSEDEYLVSVTNTTLQKSYGGKVIRGGFATNLDAAVTTRLAPTVAGRTLAVGTDNLADANVEKWNATLVPAEDTAGYPKVTIKDGTGAGEIALEAGVADANVKAMGAATNVTGSVVVSADCTNSSTVFDTDLGAIYTRTDGPKFSGLTFTSGILAKETREITAYNVNGCVTTRAFSGTPTAADTFMVINK